MPMARQRFSRQWEQCLRDMISIRHEPPYTHRYYNTNCGRKREYKLMKNDEILSVKPHLLNFYLFIAVVDYGTAEESFAASATQSAKVVASRDIAANAANFRRLRGCIISATGRRRSSRIHLFRLFSVHTLNNPSRFCLTISKKAINKDSEGSKSKNPFSKCSRDVRDLTCPLPPFY